MTPISGLGKAMTVLGMLSFLVVLTLLFGDIERSREFPNHDQRLLRGRQHCRSLGG